MNTILSKMIVLSFISVLIASTMYVFLTNNQDSYINFEYPKYEVQNFKSYNDLNSYLKTNYYNDNTIGYPSEFGILESQGSIRLDESDQDLKGSEDVENDYSDTNIQELGVDEPDIVKTDGEYLYIISDLNLYIIYAYPAEDAEVISSITFNQSDRPSNIFINDDKLVVITQSYIYRLYDSSDVIYEGEEKIWQDTTKTNVFIYDISDRKKPLEINNIEIEGYYSNARMIDDYVYIITTQYAYEPLLYNDEDSLYIPRMSLDGKVESIDINDIYYIDSPDTSKTLTNIISFNVKDDNLDITAEVFILGTPSTIYVSTNNIIITSFSYNYDYDTIYDLIIEYLLPILPDEATNELATIDSLSIDDYQKKTVSEWIIQNYVEKMDEKLKQNIAMLFLMNLEKSIIHKIRINEGIITYDSQGTVPGYVKNQFSISEYNEYIRIATTVNGWMVSSYLSSIESYNNVYVLDENLETVGSIENIANGEEIYSVRFQDNKCYLVTYKQIDPFFVIDLQDPRNPEILGELKIPGYSTYLHPYDEDKIIGIGQEENNVKISLFNVEDVINPKELSTYKIQSEDEGNKWSYSSALYEHKAFLFDREKNLLIIPISIDYIESAYIFNITSNNIKLRGIINHEPENYSEEKPEMWDNSYWPGYYDYSIKRSLFIDDVIYTISNAMIKMNDFESLNELNSINLI